MESLKHETDAEHEPTEVRHVLSEVGWNVRPLGDEMHGEAQVTPELCTPGLGHLRTSVLAAWADHLMGLLAARAMSPRVPVTLELDVHLHRPAPGSGRIRGRARTLKAGRSVFATSVEFLTDADGCIALGSGSFMLAGDPDVRLPRLLSIDRAAQPARLEVPLAERAGCERHAPGVAVLPRRADALNSSNTVNGGLIALAAEEAVLSLARDTTLCSLALRYLRPVRSGPAVARARLSDGLAWVDVFDEGNENRLSVTVIARTFTAPRS